MPRAKILKQTHHRKKPQQKKRVGNLQAYLSDAKAEYKRAVQRYYFGSHGAASPVRRIDPITGKVIEILNQPEEVRWRPLSPLVFPASRSMKTFVRGQGSREVQ